MACEEASGYRGARQAKRMRLDQITVGLMNPFFDEASETESPPKRKGDEMEAMVKLNCTGIENKRHWQAPGPCVLVDEGWWYSAFLWLDLQLAVLLRVCQRRIPCTADLTR